MYLFMAALGLCFFAETFSSCGQQRLLFLAVHGVLIVVAFLVVSLDSRHPGSAAQAP